VKTSKNFEPLVFLFSAPSGAGKSTLVEELMASVPGLRRVVTCTTRAPRTDEQDGVAYHFLDREEFDAGIERGDFIEWNEIYGDRYGTSRKVFEEAREAAKRGDEDLVLNIDVDGKANFLKDYGKAVTIFIMPPSVEELGNRLEGRGSENADDAARRLERAKEEIARADGYDYTVVNDSVGLAVDRLRQIVAAERARRDSALGIDNSSHSR